MGSIDLAEPHCPARSQRETHTHYLVAQRLPRGYIPGRPPSAQMTPGQDLASSAEKSPLPIGHHSKTSKAAEHPVSLCSIIYLHPLHPSYPHHLTSLGCNDQTARGHAIARGTSAVGLGSLSLALSPPPPPVPPPHICLQLNPDARKYPGCMAEVKTHG